MSQNKLPIIGKVYGYGIVTVKRLRPTSPVVRVIHKIDKIERVDAIESSVENRERTRETVTELQAKDVRLQTKREILLRYILCTWLTLCHHKHM